MTRTLRILLILFGLVAAASAGAVGLQRTDLVERYLNERKLSQVLADYTDRTVISTLSQLVEDLEALEATARDIHSTPTDASLKAAAEAWRSARATWKQTTSFLFGPAAHYNFDKQLATWPLDRILVDHVLDEMEAGRLDLSADHLRNKLHSSQRGLLVAEYLLFRGGQPRDIQEVRRVELDYLVATAEVLVLESTDFLAAWVGTDRLSSVRASRLAAADFKPRGSYGDEFRSPGSPGNRYASHSVSLQEIFQDSLATVEELCPVIEEALGSSDPRDSESWFSNNAVEDIQNTLKSVEFTYLGGRDDDRGHAVSDLVAAQNTILDRRVKIALADAAHRVAGVGDPYAPGGEDRDLAVRIAVASCERLAERLAVATPLVTMHPSTRPWAAYGVDDFVPQPLPTM